MLQQAIPSTLPAATRSSFVTITHKGDSILAQLAGPTIGQREAPIITAEIGRVIDSMGASLHALVLDFTDVHLVASMGLGMCIELRNRVNALGAKTVIFGLNSQLAELFKLMKIQRLCTIAADHAALAKAL